MKVLQIIPATGWRALHRVTGGDGVDFWADDVVCFALVEDKDGDTEITPMLDSEGEVVPAAHYETFYRLVGPTEEFPKKPQGA